MGRFHIQTSLAVLLVVIAGASGCGSPAGAASVWVSHWSDSNETPGISKGTVDFVEFGSRDDNAYRFAIWSDMPDGKSSSSSSALGSNYEGYHSNDAGNQIKLAASGANFKDGNGSVRVGPKTLQIADGQLILVSTQKTEPEFLQVKLPKDSEFWKIVSSSDNDPPTEFKIFAKQNKDIEEFFKTRAPQAK